MFLRSTTRLKDGKKHYYWSIVENRRCRADRVVQQTVLYLGEINDSQREQWIRAIEVFDEDAGAMEQLKLFAAERRLLAAASDRVEVRLKDFELHRPRQWGGCWLFSELWKELQLDEFWRVRLGCSREGTDWGTRAADSGLLPLIGSGPQSAFEPRARGHHSAKPPPNLANPSNRVCEMLEQGMGEHQIEGIVLEG